MKKAWKRYLGATTTLIATGNVVTVTLCIQKEKMDEMKRGEFGNALDERLDDVWQSLMDVWEARHPEHAAEFAAAVAGLNEGRPEG